MDRFMAISKWLVALSLLGISIYCHYKKLNAFDNFAFLLLLLCSCPIMAYATNKYNRDLANSYLEHIGDI